MMTSEHGPDRDPVSVDSVILRVRDLEAVTRFYEQVVGLSVLTKDGEGAVLGAAGRALLELRNDPSARPRVPQEAGLFHTAFLLPDRGALGGWLRHVAELQIPLQGLSEHLVSEAAYLADPEGNGIEIYADRPRSVWQWRNGEVAMTTERMDVAAVLEAATPWAGAPEGTMIGHVHLQVGALPEAEAFYAGQLGFDITTHYPGATFYATGGYHHHLATNVWNSRGAGVRQRPSTGLEEVRLAVREPDRMKGAELLYLDDPWGTTIRLGLTE